MITNSLTTLLLATLCVLNACKTGTDTNNGAEALTPTFTIPKDIDITTSNNGIVPIDQRFPATFLSIFDRYTKVDAANGKPIHILIDPSWSTDAIIKGRKVLAHILTNAPGTQYGSDKSAISNSIANQGAALVFLKDWSVANSSAFNAVARALAGKIQNQHANEITVEGSADYLAHKTRDASWEEIFHFVHDYGIKPTLPEYQAEIQAAWSAAAKKGFKGWPENEPGNHPNEYYICVYDNYLNLWKAVPEIYEGETIVGHPAGASHFGNYPLGNSRETIKVNDPLGLAMVEKFFPPYITFTADLPESFQGTFYINHQADKVYTHKSQFLKNIKLTGSNNAGISGNAFDNVFQGNAGDNTFDGNQGIDTVIFKGERAEYTLSTQKGITIITDKQSDRDGKDTLSNIEKIQFSDQLIEIRK